MLSCLVRSPVPMDEDNAQAPTRQLRNLKFVNNVIANVLSIVLNLFLIAVIQTQAKKQLRHYRKVLLLSTIVDLMLASLGLVLQPIYFAPNGIFIILIDGIIRPLPQPWTTVAVMLPLFVMYLLLTIVPVSFIYRYMLICKNTEPSSRVFVCLIGAAIGVSAGYTSVWTFHLWPSSSASATTNNFSKYLDNEHWYLPDGGIPPFSAAVYVSLGIGMAFWGSVGVCHVTISL
uniref:G protein-coupled receptor n=1 Tax=Panagrellus redivivus TaxID=6233 RepID=A0A7E4VT45_PANRE